MINITISKINEEATRRYQYPDELISESLNHTDMERSAFINGSIHMKELLLSQIEALKKRQAKLIEEIRLLHRLGYATHCKCAASDFTMIAGYSYCKKCGLRY